MGLSNNDNQGAAVRRWWPLLVIGCALAFAVLWAANRPQTGPPKADVTFVGPPTTLAVQSVAVVEQCDHVIPSTTVWADAGDEFSAVRPGDVVCLEAGSRAPLTLLGFQGEPDRPILFVNHGGVVEIIGTGDAYAGIDVKASEYIRVSGSGTNDWCGAEVGDDEQECGIVIQGTGRGVAGTERTGHVEVDHVEVSDTSKSGIFIRTSAESGTTRLEWSQRETHLHHNYIHRTGTEGLYVGSSSYEDGADPVLEGVDVSANLIVDTGWDGLQIGSAVDSCSIHGNRLLRTSTLDEDNQESGIMVNPGSSCDVFSNVLLDSVSRAIYVQGNGGNRVYNNLIVRAGLVSSTPGDGIVISTGSNEGESVFVWHNTIVGVGRNGILFKNEQGASNQIANNLIVGFGITDAGGAGIDSSGRDNVYVWANLMFGSLEEARFNGAGSYRLTAESPAVDEGSPLAFVGLAFDHEGMARPSGDKPDVGAFEWAVGA